MARVATFRDIAQRGVNTNNPTRTATGDDFGAQKGRAMQQFGSAISSALSSLGKAGAGQDKSTYFQQLTELNKFDTQQTLDLQNNLLSSTTGEGVFESSSESYAKGLEDIRSRVPERYRDQFNLTAERRRGAFVKRAQTGSLQVKGAYFTGEIDKTVGGSVSAIHADPTQFDTERQRIVEQIQSAPLNASVKQRLMRQQLGRLEAEHIQSRLKSGDKIQDILRDIRKQPTDNLDFKKAKGISFKNANKANMKDIIRVAEENGYDPVLALSIGHFESVGTFDTDIRPVSPNGKMVRGGKKVLSSAHGIFQFLDSSKQEHGFGTTAAEQTLAFIKKNNQDVAYVESQIGRTTKPWEKYLTHLNGLQGASDLLTANPNADLKSVIGSKAVNANPWMKGMKVGEYLESVKGKINSRLAAMSGLVYPSAKPKDDLANVESGWVYPNISRSQRAAIEKAAAKIELQRKEVQYLNSVASGEVTVSPEDTEVRKRLTKSFNTQFGPEVDFTKQGEAQDYVVQLALEGDFVPNRVAQNIEAKINSEDPTEFLAGIQLANKLSEASPAGMKAVPGGMSLEKDVETFNLLSRRLGAEKAVERMIKAGSINKDVIKGLRPELNKMLKKLNFVQVANEFDEGIFDATPGAFSEIDKQLVMSDYRYFATQSFQETGDAKIAKESALAQIKQRYGATRITGDKKLVKYPPEKFFSQKEMAALTEKFQSDLKEATEALKKDGYKIVGEPILRSDVVTERLVEQWERNKSEGHTISIPGTTAQGVQMRVRPKWNVIVMVEKNGITVPFDLGYFGQDGLPQRIYDMNVIRNEEVTKENKARAKAQKLREADQEGMKLAP